MIVKGALGARIVGVVLNASSVTGAIIVFRRIL